MISIIDERAVDPHLARASLDRLSGRAREGLIGAALCARRRCRARRRRTVRYRGAGRRSARSPASSSGCTPAATAARSSLRLVSQRSCYDIPDVERAAARMATSDLRRSALALAHADRARDLRPRAAEPAAARARPSASSSTPTRSSRSPTCWHARACASTRPRSPCAGAWSTRWRAALCTTLACPSSTCGSRSSASARRSRASRRPASRAPCRPRRTASSPAAARRPARSGAPSCDRAAP